MARYMFTLIMLTVCLQQVLSSCWLSFNPPNPEGISKDFDLYCQYKGYKMRSGSSFKSPAPFCEECTCEETTLHCCGYGSHAGVFSVPGCVHVHVEGSCEVNLRQADDTSKPCLVPL